MATKSIPRKTQFRLALIAAESSVSAWARENKVSRVHLYKVLAGEREPSAELAQKIDAVLRESAA